MDLLVVAAFALFGGISLVCICFGLTFMVKQSKRLLAARRLEATPSED